jgi:hypothetical protein
MIAAAVLALQLTLVPAEVCVASPDPPAVEPPEWHWRMVDGKKCYFRADSLLPRSDLFWEYDSAEFDAMEGATILGRKHYKPDDLRKSPDQSRPRKRLRRRRRDDDDDDD